MLFYQQYFQIPDWVRPCEVKLQTQHAIWRFSLPHGSMELFTKLYYRLALEVSDSISITPCKLTVFSGTWTPLHSGVPIGGYLLQTTKLRSLSFSEAWVLSNNTTTQTVYFKHDSKITNNTRSRGSEKSFLSISPTDKSADPVQKFGINLRMIDLCCKSLWADESQKSVPAGHADGNEWYYLQHW